MKAPRYSLILVDQFEACHQLNVRRGATFFNARMISHFRGSCASNLVTIHHHTPLSRSAVIQSTLVLSVQILMSSLLRLCRSRARFPFIRLQRTWAEWFWTLIMWPNYCSIAAWWSATFRITSQSLLGLNRLFCELSKRSAAPAFRARFWF